MSETTAPAEPGDDDAPVTVADKPREATPYEIELRKQARRYRDQARTAATEADAKVASATAAHDAAMAAEMLSAGERIKRAEMKAAAIHAGMIDPDGLKLLDLSTVKMNAAGELEVPEGFFEAAKVAKPYLFGAPVASTSGTAPRPAAAPAVAQKAADMTADEYRIAKALLLKR